LYFLSSADMSSTCSTTSNAPTSSNTPPRNGNAPLSRSATTSVARAARAIEPDRALHLVAFPPDVEFHAAAARLGEPRISRSRCA